MTHKCGNLLSLFYMYNNVKSRSAAAEKYLSRGQNAFKWYLHKEFPDFGLHRKACNCLQGQWESQGETTHLNSMIKRCPKTFVHIVYFWRLNKLNLLENIAGRHKQKL